MAIIETADASQLQRLQSAMGGNLLTASSLGNILAANNKSLLVISTGSSGSALLLNPDIQGRGLIHPDLSLPKSLAIQVKEMIGVAPDQTHKRNTWAVDAYLEIALSDPRPDLTILWLNGQNVRAVDAEIGRIEKKHRSLKIDINLMVTSHGATVASTGPVENLAGLLVKIGAKKDLSSTDLRVVGGNSIFLENGSVDTVRDIVKRLQRIDWIGAIYTQQVRPTHPEGIAEGALSFQAVYIDHERAPDILIEPAWSETPDEEGHPGTKRRFGGIENPTSSLHELSIPLIVYGPSFKRGTRCPNPSANYDLAPTLCHLLGIEIPESMYGRVLHEALQTGPDPSAVDVLRRRHGAQANWDGGHYRLMMTEYSVDGTDYFESTTLDK